MTLLSWVRPALALPLPSPIVVEPSPARLSPVSLPRPLPRRINMLRAATGSAQPSGGNRCEVGPRTDRPAAGQREAALSPSFLSLTFLFLRVESLVPSIHFPLSSTTRALVVASSCARLASLVLLLLLLVLLVVTLRAQPWPWPPAERTEILERGHEIRSTGSGSGRAARAATPPQHNSDQPPTCLLSISTHRTHPPHPLLPVPTAPADPLAARRSRLQHSTALHCSARLHSWWAPVAPHHLQP